MNLFDFLQTGTDSYQLGEKLFRRGSISVAPSPPREEALCYYVGSSPAQTVTLYANNAFACTCGAAGASVSILSTTTVTVADTLPA